MSRKWNHGDTRRVLREAEASEPPDLKTKPVLFYREGGLVMKRFWDLLRESVIGRLILAMMFSSATIYLLVTQRPVPVELWAVNSLILGSFFGSKGNQAAKGER